jgi:hypothetical protein
MRILTLIPTDCSTRLIVDDSELTFADSGDELQKGKVKFVLPLAPLLNSFLPDVQHDEAHLLGYSTPSGVASFNGTLPNSGEVYGGTADVLGEIERDCGQRGVAEH